MNIGVDVSSLCVNDQSKTGNYWLSKQYLEEIIKLKTNDNFILFSYDKIDDEVIDNLPKNYRTIICGPKKFWMQGTMTYELLRHKVDLFIGLNQAIPYLTLCPSIVVFLDIAFEKFRNNYPKNYRKLSWQSKRASANCTEIIAISESTKKDLIDLYNIPSAKIHVVHPFIETFFKKPAVNIKNDLFKKFKINKPYFLFVGKDKKSKNVDKIKQAYDLLPNKIKNLYDLIIASEHFKFLSRVDLAKLYQGAFCFISPSDYEGFGFPLLESISCNVPVICGSGGSQKEVVGSAGIYINTSKIDATERLKEAMLMVIENKQLYNGLKNQTAKESLKFSQKNTIEQLNEVFKKYE